MAKQTKQAAAQVNNTAGGFSVVLPELTEFERPEDNRAEETPQPRNVSGNIVENEDGSLSLVLVIPVVGADDDHSAYPLTESGKGPSVATTRGGMDIGPLFPSVAAAQGLFVGVNAYRTYPKDDPRRAGNTAKSEKKGTKGGKTQAKAGPVKDVTAIEQKAQALSAAMGIDIAKARALASIL